MLINRRDILTSPGFVISLSLLLINDFYLKPALSTPLTGKLSDFAGLFAFTLFWIAMFPQFRRGICLAILLGFAFWKSSYSQPVIDSWNGLGIVRFSRTIDLTDLIALSVIPPAYSYASRRVSRTLAPNWMPTSLALIAIFTFGATSYSTQYADYGNKYYFAGSKSELFKKIDDLHLLYFDYPLRKEQMESGKLDLCIPAKMCRGSIYANLEVVEVDKQTIVSIRKLRNECRNYDGAREKLLAEFEREFIERLKSGTPQTAHYKSDAETPGFTPPRAQYPTPLQASPARARGKS